MRVRIGVHEAVAEPAQRVGRVEGERVLAAQRIHSTTAFQSGLAGSMWPKWSSSGSTTSSHSSPAAHAAAWNASLIAGGTMSSRPPCVNSAGTPSGRRAAGEAAA